MRGGHTHHGEGSVDDVLETTKEGIRALQVSLAVLGVTAGLQLVVFRASGSVALLADTMHNFADALTALPLGLAFWLGRRPATKRYPYGYGRSEDLAGILVVVTIALSAGIAGRDPQAPTAHHFPGRRR